VILRNSQKVGIQSSKPKTPPRGLPSRFLVRTIFWHLLEFTFYGIFFPRKGGYFAPQVFATSDILMWRGLRGTSRVEISETYERSCCFGLWWIDHASLLFVWISGNLQPHAQGKRNGISKKLKTRYIGPASACLFASLAWKLRTLTYLIK